MIRSIFSKVYLMTAAAVCMLCLTASATGQQHPSGDEAESVKLFLQKYFSDLPAGTDKTTRFSSAPVKGSDGAIEEVVVYVVGENWCGSGGCTLLVLMPYESSYRVIGRATIVKLPIRILHTSTNGRHDIGVWVSGGGIQKGYEALLQFDGKAYPSNPTVPPARRLTRRTAGAVLISTAEDAQPLFE
jgi:hypothetical protein